MFAPLSRTLAFALAVSVGAGAVVVEAAPARVVSINLCTDQLAMLLAAPGQLVSISHVASDPLSSSMAQEAAAYPQNRGSAEQVYLLHPDLVLAGEYTDPATVDLLRRLEVPVVQVPIVNSLDEVPEQLHQVATALGREAEGEAMIADFNRSLAELAYERPRISAALYYPSGYTTGGGTLADDVLHHTGFTNIAEQAGLLGGGFMPLERLVMTQPRLIVTSRPYPGASRAEEILRHPALAAVGERAQVVAANDGDWLCGTPYILRAVRVIRDMREALE